MGFWQRDDARVELGAANELPARAEVLAALRSRGGAVITNRLYDARIALSERNGRVVLHYDIDAAVSGRCAALASALSCAVMMLSECTTVMTVILGALGYVGSGGFVMGVASMHVRYRTARALGSARRSTRGTLPTARLAGRRSGRGGLRSG